MAELDEKKLNEDEATDEDLLVLTLTDEESGEEKDYVVMAQAEIDANLYYCVMTVDAYNSDKEEDQEYGILRATGEGDDVILETIDDDDEFEKVSDYFDDLLFGEEDYDN